MLKRWLVLLLLLGSGTTPAQAGVCADWNKLFVQIRDFQLAPAQAKAEIADCGKCAILCIQNTCKGSCQQRFMVIAQSALSAFICG